MYSILILFLSLCFPLPLLLPVLLEELFLIVLLSYGSMLAHRLPVIFHALLIVGLLFLCTTCLHTFSEAKALQLVIKGHKVYLALKLGTTGLVDHHIPDIAPFLYSSQPGPQ